MKKARISPYIDKKTKEAMTVYAKRLKISESHLVELALNQFMAPDNPEKREQAMLRKFDQLNKTVRSIKRDNQISSEMLSSFVRLYLSCTSELPDSEKEAAARAGGARFDKFKTYMKERLRNNKIFGEELMEEITLEANDFDEMEIKDTEVQKEYQV
jgi:hypothetical protein